MDRQEVYKQFNQLRNDLVKFMDEISPILEECDRSVGDATPTGRVKSVDDINSQFVYFIDEVGAVIKSGDAETAIEQGNVFHDKGSAEKEALARKVKHKLFCEFGGNGLVVVPSNWRNHEHYKGVSYLSCYTNHAVEAFIDTLTEEELNSLKGV